jgi:acyl-coenzyme A synthetase/AMP-(fatty) acid ligase
VTLGSFLRSLDRIGLHLPAGPERTAIARACERAGVSVVDISAAPEVLVTADGVMDGGLVRPLKEEVDAAVPGARTVIVLRLVGDGPLAATMDAYLDVEMREGRDVWFDEMFTDQVGASG